MDEPNLKQLMKYGGVGKVVGGLRAYGDSPQVAVMGCAALRMIAETDRQLGGGQLLAQMIVQEDLLSITTRLFQSGIEPVQVRNVSCY
jgi:hypothetical protein